MRSRMRLRMRAVVVTLAATLAVGIASPSVAQGPVVNIGVVVDGPWERNDEVFGIIRHEILSLTEHEFDVRFPEGSRRVADWTVAGVREALTATIADPEVDIVLTLGTVASAIVIAERELPKPVIAPFVVDARLSRAPRDGAGSGVHNLSYLAIPDHVARDLRMFREIVPFETITLLVNQTMAELVPDLAAACRQHAASLGIETRMVTVGHKADPVLAALGDDTEAVYLAPLLILDEGEFDRLIAGLNERKIPTFSLLGAAEVERGVLAGLTPAKFLTRLARRVALHVQSILLGEEAGELSVVVTDQERLVVNMATARAIGLYPPWSVLTEAELINDERRDVERRIDLSSAMREAIQANLDLAANERAVAAGREEVGLARSTLLPQADIAAQGVWIDGDRAESVFFPAERTLYGSGSLTQLLYSDAAWAGYTIQKHVQETREWERAALRLDIALAASTAYLDVLRAKTFERIERVNLEVSRENLELARVREAIGQAGPEEVYRWESEIAGSRRAVIRTNSARNLLEIELNRLLRRPLEESFLTVDSDLDEPLVADYFGRLGSYFANPWSFKMLRAVLVELGLEAAPELRQIDAAIAAQERGRSAAGRAFWMPDFALQGEVTGRLAEDGKGADTELPSLPGVAGGDIDDNDWNVAVAGSLPLLEGGGRIHQLARSRALVEQLYLEREAVSQRVEQRIRSALHVAGASYASIRQAELAAAAARRNLELVTDSYSKGVVSIIRLLDAQNQARLAQQAASTATYDFLIDFMGVLRAVNQIDIFAAQAEREAWFDRVDEEYARVSAESEADR